MCVASRDLARSPCGVTLWRAMSFGERRMEGEETFGKRPIADSRDPCRVTLCKLIVSTNIGGFIDQSSIARIARS